MIKHRPIVFTVGLGIIGKHSKLHSTDNLKVTEIPLFHGEPCGDVNISEASFLLSLDKNGLSFKNVAHPHPWSI